ncbi:hypothetical protein D9M71_693650 [compost metagenome]
MGVEAAPACRIRKLRHEIRGAGLAYRILQLGVAGAGVAVEQVVADRAVQQGGVLGDHADLRAQALLGHLGDVLAVDEDAPAFQVVEAQQQVHQG